MASTGSLVGNVTDVDNCPDAARVLRWMLSRSGVGSAERTETGAMTKAGQLAQVGADPTTREQRTSRDVTAGWVGKALKAKILWAGVARNKATRLRWEKAVERVRNPEGGRRWLGKPTRYDHRCLPRRKETNPMGGVVVFPLRVLRPGAHFGETPRARQPSGHLCDRLSVPLPTACG